MAQALQSIHPRDLTRHFFMGLGLLFLSYLLLTALMRSRERTSLLSNDVASDTAAGYFSGMPAPDGGGSKLRLQQFHRVAVKNGVPAWEVKARDAQYYSKEGVTYLNDAGMTMYSEEDSKVHLRAKSAKLHMVNEILSKAELVGDILVIWDSNLKVYTELALYQVERGEISAPEHVRIEGEGYSIEGDGLELKLGPQTFKLAKNVKTVFTSSAKAPKGELLLRKGES